MIVVEHLPSLPGTMSLSFQRGPRGYRKLSVATPNIGQEVIAQTESSIRVLSRRFLYESLDGITRVIDPRIVVPLRLRMEVGRKDLRDPRATDVR